MDISVNHDCNFNKTFVNITKGFLSKEKVKKLIPLYVLTVSAS